MVKRFGECLGIERYKQKQGRIEQLIAQMKGLMVSDVAIDSKVRGEDFAKSRLKSEINEYLDSQEFSNKGYGTAWKIRKYEMTRIKYHILINRLNSLESEGGRRFSASAVNKKVRPERARSKTLPKEITGLKEREGTVKVTLKKCY